MIPKETAVEWLQQQLNKTLIDNQIQQTLHLFDKAKKMEKIQEQKRLLLIGKTSKIIGFDKTAEILKEIDNEIKNGI